MNRSGNLRDLQERHTVFREGISMDSFTKGVTEASISMTVDVTGWLKVTNNYRGGWFACDMQRLNNKGRNLSMHSCPAQ